MSILFFDWAKKLEMAPCKIDLPKVFSAQIAVRNGSNFVVYNFKMEVWHQIICYQERENNTSMNLVCFNKEEGGMWYGYKTIVKKYKDNSSHNPRTGVLFQFSQQKVQEMSAVLDWDPVCLFYPYNEKYSIAYASFLILELWTFLHLWYAYESREIMIFMLSERILLMYILMLINI